VPTSYTTPWDLTEEVLRAVKVRGAYRQGRQRGDRGALRRELGFDLLDRPWQRSDLDERQALALAVEAQYKTRRRRR